jgi:hypothetical protein
MVWLEAFIELDKLLHCKAGQRRGDCDTGTQCCNDTMSTMLDVFLSHTLSTDYGCLSLKCRSSKNAPHALRLAESKCSISWSLRALRNHCHLD